jgi:hypothetical protein
MARISVAVSTPELLLAALEARDHYATVKFADTPFARYLTEQSRKTAARVVEHFGLGSA